MNRGRALHHGPVSAGIWTAAVVMLSALLACTLASPIGEPRATATPPAQPTASVIVTTLAPTARPTQVPGVLFADDFSDLNSGWARDRGQGFVYSYSEGEYVIHVPESDQVAIGVGLLEDQVFSAAVLTVQVTQRHGDPTTTNSMIVWGAQDYFNYYALLLTADGYANVTRLDAGNLVTLYDWTWHPSVHTGLETNYVAIAFAAGSATIYINDVLITAIADDTLSEGSVGLGGQTNMGGGMETAFDNVVIFETGAWTPPSP